MLVGNRTIVVVDVVVVDVVVVDVVVVDVVVDTAVVAVWLFCCLIVDCCC